MRTLNKIQLIGRVGADPEIKNISGESKVAKFPLATNESYTDKVSGEVKESTDWHNITAWNGIASVIESYIKKGSLIYVEGKLRNRSYEDSEGNKKYYTEIQISNLIMLDKKEMDQQSIDAEPKVQLQSPSSFEPVGPVPVADDLPF